MPEPADAPDAEHPTAPAPAPRMKARASAWQSWLVENWRLASGVALFAAGIAFVLLGWYGAAYTNIITEQIPYLISGGLLGLGLIIVAGILISGMGNEREVRALRAQLGRVMRDGGPVVDGPVADDAARANGHHVFVVPGGRSYHEAGCPILEGKDDVKELVPAQASGSGYAACRLCDPEA